jgi:hypothetical protein
MGTTVIYFMVGNWWQEDAYEKSLHNLQFQSAGLLLISTQHLSRDIIVMMVYYYSHDGMSKSVSHLSLD